MSQNNPQNAPTEAIAPGDVRYRVGFLIFVLVVLVPTLAVFGYAAFDQSLLMSLSEQRRASWLALLTVFEFYGINWAIVAFIAALLWETRKLIRQLRDPFAIRIKDDALTFNASIGEPDLPFSEIADINHIEGSLRSDLLIRPQTRPPIRISNVERCEADGLVSMIEQRLESAESTPPQLQ